MVKPYVHNTIYLRKPSSRQKLEKKMFIRLYELAKVEGNDDLINFCRAILEIYEKYNINGHIKWKK